MTRALTARAAAAWRTAHPGGTVTYRDLGADPLPHLDAAAGLARMLPPGEHTPAQARSYELTRRIVMFGGQVRGSVAADTWTL